MSTVRQTGINSILAQLGTISFLNTVVQKNREINLTRYTQADLPLVAVSASVASPRITRGMLYEEEVVLTMTVFWVDFDDATDKVDTYYEALIEGLEFDIGSGVVLDLTDRSRYELLNELEYPLNGFKVSFILRVKAGSISDI